jgi:hypothetical protein
MIKKEKNGLLSYAKYAPCKISCESVRAKKFNISVLSSALER